MIKTVIECETCKTQSVMKAFDHLRGMQDQDIPEAWFTLFSGKMGQRVSHHFCSQASLKAWLISVASEDHSQ
jgi:hypothetical protein